jgi:DNA polymerase phi
MVGLIRNTKVPKDEEWISLVLEFLFVHAFFDVVKNGSKVSKVNDMPNDETYMAEDILTCRVKANTQPTPALSPATRTVCRDRFFAILGELSTMPPVAKVAELGGSVLKTRKLNGTMNNGEFWADHAVQRYRALEKDTKHYKNVVEFDEESSQAKKDAFKTIEKIKADVCIIVLRNVSKANLSN